jgi:SAM-dependent methyltransferase
MQDNPRTQVATDDNFEADLYVAANAGVAAHVARGGIAWSHFDKYGRNEGRHQLTPEAAGLVGTRQHRKYERFRSALAPSRGAGGRFEFVGERDAFPVRYGDVLYDLSAYENESANHGIGQFHEHVRRHPDRLFADIGCGRRHERFDNCLYLEVYASASADVVMEPACRYPLADESLDGIGCFAVLEHVPDPVGVAREIARIVRPGGIIVIDYPFMQPVHGYPSHYFNATREGLRLLFEDQFDTIEIDTLGHQTPDHALCWQLVEWRDAIGDEGVRGELEGMTVAQLLAHAPGDPFWQRVLGATPPRTIEALAAGNTLMARRRG